MNEQGSKKVPDETNRKGDKRRRLVLSRTKGCSQQHQRLLCFMYVYVYSNGMLAGRSADLCTDKNKVNIKS